MIENWQRAGFGLYVHWPFCESKCPYCDFNSHVRSTIKHAVWKRAFVSELKRYAELTNGRRLSTIFFGGGTPSLMEPAVVAEVIDTARQLWPGSNDLEITLEANPSSVEQKRFEDFAAAGVNRISMGIQALNDADLRRLGRLHSVNEAKAAFEIARRVFAEVSFDLIYARQGQMLENWRSELTEALSMAVDHLSLYQLTIEPETRFGALYDLGKLKHLPNDDLAADMFSLTQEVCEQHGYPAYEVSNHAKPGHESRHNTLYWKYGDYIGIGPGAHGRLHLENRYATEAVRSPEEWLHRAMGAGDHETWETLTNAEAEAETLLMGLRLREGIALETIPSLSVTDAWENACSELIEHDLINLTNGQIMTTDQGRPLLNAILAKLLTE